ncbi:MAG: hypothetical protein G8345_16065 [Magnetococcales bacterium]|nr:hypothetical protein [Magnetococcales bacterium]NGZ28390.1 hypothetical protein [Magnetococcales bacterium]
MCDSSPPLSGMVMKKGAMLLCLGLALLTTPVISAENAAKTAPAAGLLDQKSGVVERFLQRSETLQQDKARSESVQKEVERIRQLHKDAQAARQANDLAKAQALLDKAVSSVLTLSRQLADPAKQAWLHKAHYEDLQEGVAAFEQSYLRHQQATDGKEKGSVDLDKVHGLVNQAKELAASQNYEKANPLLAQARDMLVKGLKGMLNAKTLVYDLKFATPADEYKYELDRAASLESLVRMALTGGKVSGPDQKRVMELTAKSQEMNLQGRSLAASQDYKGAISVMEKSNELLIQALRAAGMPVF